MILSLSYFVNVMVAQQNKGVSTFNTSNLALFTREEHSNSFGTDPYKIYKNASDVGLDFGTSSDTYQMAVRVFSQSKNILTNNGYLVIIPFLDSEKFDQAVTRTKALVQYLGAMCAEIVSEADGLAAAAVIQALPKLGIVASHTEADVEPGGFIDLIRTQNLDQMRGLYFGIEAIETVETILFSSLPASGNYKLSYNGNQTADIAYNANAAAVQTALRLLPGLGSVTVIGAAAQGFQVTFAGVDGDALLIVADNETLEDSLSNNVLITVKKNVVGLSAAGAVTQVLVNQAAYASRLLSTVFSGSNTTQTMHGKDLAGAYVDNSMDDTLLAKCKAAGADVYANFEGLAKVFTSGANKFVDRVYNRLWFVNAAGVAYANVILQNPSKVPQTEDGMTAFKGAVRRVCKQAIRNQYFAPGTWTDPNTFGDQQDFLANISTVGYYIFMDPIADQSPEDRDNRVNPLMQIAGKEAGAAHSGNVLITLKP